MRRDPLCFPLPCWICPCPASCFLFSPALDFLGNRLREKHGRRQRQRAAARPLCGERASRRLRRCGGSGLGFLLPLLLLLSSSFSCSFSSCKKRAESGKLCQPDSAKKLNGARVPVAPPRGWSGARAGRQANRALLPVRSPLKMGASASAPARRALPVGTHGHQLT